MYKIVIFFYIVALNALITDGSASRIIQCPTLKLNHGRVKYRQKGRLAKFTCNSNYSLAGDRYTTCIRGEWETPTPVCIKPSCTKIKPPINGFIYPAYNGGLLNFYCKPLYTIRGKSSIYCDGYRWSNNLPICILNNTGPALSCDFESEDLCGWTHDLNHEFDWRRHYFETPSGHIGTGPKFDHTKGPGNSGHYVYTESTSRLENDRARLVSPLYDKMPNGFCFTFYYHMYGATIGQLKVYVKKESDTTNTRLLKPLFTESGNQGNVWKKGVINLESVNENFQIIIEGVRGKSYLSDIAIDDVSLAEYCEEEISTSTTTDMSTEPIPIIESCENRCDNLTDVNSNNASLILCECVESCFEKNTCCPDYVVFCALEASTDSDDMDYSIPLLEEENTMFTSTIATEAATSFTSTIQPVQTTQFEHPKPAPQIFTTFTPVKPTTETSLELNTVKQSTENKTGIILPQDENTGLNNTGKNSSSTLNKPEKPKIDAGKNGTKFGVLAPKNTTSGVGNDTGSGAKLSPVDKSEESPLKGSQEVLTPKGDASGRKTPPKMNPPFQKPQKANGTTSEAGSGDEKGSGKNGPKSGKGQKDKDDNQVGKSSWVKGQKDNKGSKKEENSIESSDKGEKRERNPSLKPVTIIETTTEAPKIANHPHIVPFGRISTTEVPVIPEEITEKSQTPEIMTDYEGSTEFNPNDVLKNWNNEFTIEPKVQMLSESDKKHTEGKSSTNSVLVISVCACLIVLTVVGIVVVVKRYAISCRKLKFQNSRNNDSLSDVRFLASEEVLDFTWRGADD